MLCLVCLTTKVLSDNMHGSGTGSLIHQVQGTMLVTIFVFLGVEGAGVYSRYAQRREHVGQATIPRARQRARRVRQCHGQGA
jgi:arginine:ornithine antiporter/lysine permease